LNTEPASLPQTSLRIAAAQAQPVSGNVPANIAKTVELTARAADRNAKLVVFPEKFLSGYEPDLIAGDPARYAFDEHDARLEPIREICRQREIAVIVGASAVWGPYGDVVAQASRDHEEVITALLDPETLADVRERETVLADFNARGDEVASDYVVHRLG